jgi:hypothetical protein
MLDLSAARYVDVRRPVERVALLPQRAIRMLDALRHVVMPARAQNLFHAVEAQPLLAPREVGRVGDQRFPEIECDGFERQLSFTRPVNPSS